MSTPTQLYNLVWICNGIVREVILYGKPRAVCYWRRNKLRDHYTYGLLQVRPF